MAEFIDTEKQVPIRATKMILPPAVWRAIPNKIILALMTTFLILTMTHNDLFSHGDFLYHDDLLSHNNFLSHDDLLSHNNFLSHEDFFSHARQFPFSQRISLARRLLFLTTTSEDATSFLKMSHDYFFPQEDFLAISR